MSSPETRSRTLAAVLLALALVVGALAGIAVDRLVLLPRGAIAGEAPPPARMPPGDRPGALPRGADVRFLDFIDRELALTAEQRTRIEAILRDQQARVREITRETRPQVQRVARDTRAAIDQVLTSEQRGRLRELLPRDGFPERQRRGLRGHGEVGDASPR